MHLAWCSNTRLRCRRNHGSILQHPQTPMIQQASHIAHCQDSTLLPAAAVQHTARRDSHAMPPDPMVPRKPNTFFQQRFRTLQAMFRVVHLLLQVSELLLEGVLAPVTLSLMFDWVGVELYTVVLVRKLTGSVSICWPCKEQADTGYKQAGAERAEHAMQATSSRLPLSMQHAGVQQWSVHRCCSLPDAF